jgi:hypothetical protein
MDFGARPSRSETVLSKKRGTLARRFAVGSGVSLVNKSPGAFEGMRHYQVSNVSRLVMLTSDCPTGSIAAWAQMQRLFAVRAEASAAANSCASAHWGE